MEGGHIDEGNLAFGLGASEFAERPRRVTPRGVRPKLATPNLLVTRTDTHYGLAGEVFLSNRAA